MKKFLSDFLKRGLMTACVGPLLMAYRYGTGMISNCSPQDVCMGILTTLLLGVFVGGITVVYCVEKLPLSSAVLLHLGAMYIAYLLIFMVNGWMPMRIEVLIHFTVQFLTQFLVYWTISYHWNKARIRKINQKLRERNSEA